MKKETICKTVVDTVTGLEKESWIEDGVKFHRDDEYHAAMLTEKDYKELAGNLTDGGAYFCFNVDSMVESGIDAVNNLQRTFHAQEYDFSQSETTRMKADMVNRLSERMEKYGKGKKISTIDFGEGKIGFRFE